MNDWIIQNFGSFDNFILLLLAVGLLIVISLMFAALRLTFYDDIETEDKTMSDLDDNYDEDYRKLRDSIFYISIVIFSDLLNIKDNDND